MSTWTLNRTRSRPKLTFQILRCPDTAVFNRGFGGSYPRNSLLQNHHRYFSMSAKLKSWIFLFTRIVLGRRNAKKAFASEATPPGPDGEITTLRQTFSPLEGIPAPHFPTFLDAFGISFSAGNEPFRNVSAYTALSGHTRRDLVAVGGTV